MSDKIPTAEEFARDEYEDQSHIDEFGEKPIDMKHALWMMNIHAQRHVEAALKAAAENARITKRSMDNYSKDGPIKWSEVNKDSILNAYPKENII